MPPDKIKCLVENFCKRLFGSNLRETLFCDRICLCLCMVRG
ncbi:unnamed protein product [Brugia timori]|uniref:Uncharacterized protein n=1 Tax=Brugia timori TaxID=42155 RepID=A0A0R3QAH9_9BILA|nr:unnamed protein product [Brugia timori]